MVSALSAVVRHKFVELPFANVRTAIYAQHLPCNLPRFCQIDRGAGNLLNRGDRAHRRKLLQNIVRIVRVQRCVDDAGGNGVKSNVLFCVFKSQASYDRVQTTFGDHWNGSWHSDDWVIRQRCADANNASTVFLRLHLLDRELCDVNEAGEVGCNQGAKIFCRIFSERLYQENSSIRDDRIDRAELLEGEFCNFLRCFNLPYVAVDQREMVGS